MTIMPSPARVVARFSSILAAILVASTFVAADPATAQGRDREDKAFAWSGTVPAGRRVIVRNVNGAIRVERSTSGRVDITADKSWRRGNPDDVRIEQQKLAGDDVLVCALWHPDARCEEGGIRGGRSVDNRNDVSVAFTVRVPDGVRVEVHTVNGALHVEGATAEVRASTVNGSIDARSSGGPVRAKTVNGSIKVAMGTTGGSGDLEYETVNGSIAITLPAGIGADLDLSVVNGRITTDLPVSVTGSLSPRRLRGTIGDGGTRLRASTVNGGITLRKGGGGE